MDFNITAGEETVVFHMASLVHDGPSPTDDDLAKELGEEIRPVLQSLLDKGWLVIDEDRELALSAIARMSYPAAGTPRDRRRSESLPSPWFGCRSQSAWEAQVADEVVLDDWSSAGDEVFEVGSGQGMGAEDVTVCGEPDIRWAGRYSSRRQTRPGRSCRPRLPP